MTDQPKLIFSTIHRNNHIGLWQLVTHEFKLCFAFSTFSQANLSERTDFAGTHNQIYMEAEFVFGLSCIIRTFLEISGPQ